MLAAGGQARQTKPVFGWFVARHAWDVGSFAHDPREYQRGVRSPSRSTMTKMMMTIMCANNAALLQVLGMVMMIMMVLEADAQQKEDQHAWRAGGRAAGRPPRRAMFRG